MNEQEVLRQEVAAAAMNLNTMVKNTQNVEYVANYVNKSVGVRLYWWTSTTGSTVLCIRVD